MDEVIEIKNPNKVIWMVWRCSDIEKTGTSCDPSNQLLGLKFAFFFSEVFQKKLKLRPDSVKNVRFCGLGKGQTRESALPEAA